MPQLWRMNSTRRRVGGKILVWVMFALGVSSLSAPRFARALDGGPIISTIIKTGKTIGRIGGACKDILSEVGDGLDAVPFTRKIIDRVTATGWKDNFDLSIYHDAKSKYLKLEPLELEQWGLPETRLAYLSALIERATGMPVSLADNFINDIEHAKALQLFCKDVDFSRPLSSFQIKALMERAFLLTGKLDIDAAHFRNLNPDRLHKLTLEYIWKDIAIHGVIDLYTKFHLRIFTKAEMKEIVNNEIVDLAKSEMETAAKSAVRTLSETERTQMYESILAKKIADVKPALLKERMEATMIEGTKARWTRFFKDPRTKIALASLTWNPAAIATRLRPGVLPEYDFVSKFIEKSSGPEKLKECMERGFKECLEFLESDVTGPLLTDMRRVTRKQYYYDFVRHKFAWWAGILTVGYAAGELYGLDDDKIQDWILDQGKYAMDEFDRAFFQNDGKLPANFGAPPVVF